MKTRITVLLVWTILWIGCSEEKSLVLRISNPLDIDRTNEMVEISQKEIWTKLGLEETDRIVIRNDRGEQIPYQIAIDWNMNSDSLLIFQVDVNALGESVYTVKKGLPDIFGKQVAGRLVPERMDDFNWENDRIAFRMYGPALQATGEISNGIDIWAKRTSALVADAWYADELSGKSSYHTDNGEGLDFYKVGPTLGAGAAAPFWKDTLWLSKNFTTYEILENGPLRISFRLNYEPFEVTDFGRVESSRVISLDAGSQLNKVRQTYTFNGDIMLPVAAGIVLRNSSEEQSFFAEKKTYVAHAEVNDPINGMLFEGIVSAIPFEEIGSKNGHVVGVRTLHSSEPFVYYAGGGWSKFGFPEVDNWVDYIDAFSRKLQTPLRISFH